MKRSFVKIVAGAIVAALPVVVAGQSLTGTVVAADTGSPLPGATVVAIQKTLLPSQRPNIYKTATDATGHYTITPASGLYQLCVQGAGLYLDPCQWGGAISANVTSVAALSVPLVLQKGATFILRVHDATGLLPLGEAIPGANVHAYLTGAAVKQFPLPVTYDDGRIRDYSAVVPLNSALTAVASSGSVTLADKTGAAVDPLGVPFQVSPADVSAPNPLTGPLALMFPRPNAKVVHVYATGQK